jgi:F-type H+-transporting ATPase subunit b
VELLTSLGVNSTLFIQMASFFVVFLVLKGVVFGPYFKSYLERQERTVGRAELAEKFISETKDLEVQYSVKAQEINENVKAVYDRSRSEAMKQYDQTINAARATGKSLLEDARGKIQKEVQAASQQIAQEVNGASQLIISRLVGKDLNS